MAGLSSPHIRRENPLKISPPPAESFGGEGEGIQKGGKPVFSIGFVIFFLICCNVYRVEASSGQRDPFALPPGIVKGEGLQKKGGTGKEKEIQAGVPMFQLTTILVSGQTKVAALNGVLRQKGDEISGYRIVEIEEKQVTLSRGKEKLVLKIDQGGGFSFKKLKSNNQTMGFSK
jgi:hypothetical protein